MNVAIETAAKDASELQGSAQVGQVLTACSACFDNMTFLVASMTYCFLKFAVLSIVCLAIATIALFIVT
jgi:hypothetical protein